MVLACVLAIAVGTVGGASAAEAGPVQASTGRIVFASARGDGMAIHTMTPNGETTSKALAPGINPRWSRRGTRIAFVRGGDIWVMRANGTAVQQLTKNAGDDKNPSWSPDEAYIAFASNRSPHRGNYDLYVQSVAGDAPLRRLTTGGGEDRYPAWSPDGKLIAYQSDNQIHVMRADGTGKKSLTNADSNTSPAWSPDGTRIAFASNRHGNFEIYSMSPTGSDVERLISDEPGKLYSDTDPAWSPDGSRVAFSTSRGGRGDIYVVPARGGELTRLTQSPAEDTTSDWWPQAVPTIKLLESRVASGVLKITAACRRDVTHGTGFLVGAHFVATAHHVVEDADKIRRAGAPRSPLRVVGSDERTDLALLYSKTPIPGYQFSLVTRPAEQDDSVLILGYPENAVRMKRRNGTVTDVDRGALRVEPGVAVGNSGGPVVRGLASPVGTAGDVVGVAVEEDNLTDETIVRPAATVRQKINGWRRKFERQAAC